jgi:hypothetical protein
VLLNSSANPESFAIEIELVNSESKTVASVILPPFSLTRPHANVTYYVNHKDLKLLNGHRKACGSVTFTAAIASTDIGDPKQQLEPTLRFLDTSVSALEKEPKPVTVASQPWEIEATKNGWVSEQSARVIWEKIAFAKGWKPPQPPKMEIQTALIDEYLPADVDLISFAADAEPIASAGSEGLEQPDGDRDGQMDELVDFVLRSRLAVESGLVFEKQSSFVQSEKYIGADLEPEFQVNV